MKIQSLGHVVVRVGDLERSEAFYRDVLGLPVCAHFDQDGMKMAFFTLGNHHDFALSQSKELGDAAASGLDHVAFKIGDNIEDLKEAKQMLDRHGVETMPIDHEVTQSLYFCDPDGNGIEVYIDTSDVWRNEPQKVAQVAPLEI